MKEKNILIPNYDVSQEHSQMAYLNILEDMQLDKKAIDDQRKATFNILDDVTEFQEELKGRLIQVQTLRDTLENLAISVDPKHVMETVVQSLTKLIPYYTLSYVIWQGQGVEFANTIYINAKGPIGRAYVSNIQRELVAFVEHLPSSVINGESLARQIRKKMYTEFVSGSLDEDRGLIAKSSIIIPFHLRTGESSKQSSVLGLFHIASINPKDRLTQYQLEIIHDVAGVAAMNMGRIRSIAATEQARLASLLRSMTNGVILIDSFRNVLLLNPSAAEMLGLAEHNPVEAMLQQQQQQQQVTFKEIEKLLDSKTFNFAMRFNRLLKKGKESHVAEFSISRFTYEIFLTPVRDISGGIIGGAIVLHDITHIKEIDRMKTEFVSVASHQLRTPLTAIKLFIEIIAKGDAGKLSDKQKEYIGDVSASTERMIKLVNDLLNVSRLETGRLKIAPKPTNLEEFVEGIVKDALPLCEEKECKLLFERSKNVIGEIMVDQSLFRQVIHNLITNAIRYSKHNGNIVVSLKDTDEGYSVIVSDDGIGIPKETQSRIFEKFFRADNAQKAEAEGSGLGLYVANMIVNAFGGKIRFESTVGKGTTFSVTIPHKGMKKREGERGLAEN